MQLCRILLFGLDTQMLILQMYQSWPFVLSQNIYELHFLWIYISYVIIMTNMLPAVLQCSLFNWGKALAIVLYPISRTVYTVIHPQPYCQLLLLIHFSFSCKDSIISGIQISKINKLLNLEPCCFWDKVIHPILNMLERLRLGQCCQIVHIQLRKQSEQTIMLLKP